MSTEQKTKEEQPKQTDKVTIRFSFPGSAGSVAVEIPAKCQGCELLMVCKADEFEAAYKAAVDDAQAKHKQAAEAKEQEEALASLSQNMAGVSAFLQALSEMAEEEEVMQAMEDLLAAILDFAMVQNADNWYNTMDAFKHYIDVAPLSPEKKEEGRAILQLMDKIARIESLQESLDTQDYAGRILHFEHAGVIEDGYVLEQTKTAIKILTLHDYSVRSGGTTNCFKLADITVLGLEEGWEERDVFITMAHKYLGELEEHGTPAEKLRTKRLLRKLEKTQVD